MTMEKYVSENEWRRSSRMAYYFMARGMWRASSLPPRPSWKCRWRAVWFMMIFVAMTVTAFLLRREIPTLHALRTRHSR